MTITYINTTSVSSGSVAVTVAASDGLAVLAHVALGASTGIAVDAAGTANFIHIMGSTYGQTFGVRLSATTSALAGHQLIVGEDGTIWGNQQSGVQSLSGNSFILNHGTIGGDFAAVTYDETGNNSHSRLMNHGNLTGAQRGANVVLSDGADLTIENAAGATISGGQYALFIDCSNTCDVRISNAGQILSTDSSEGVAIATDSPARIINLLNTGRILGDILLGNSRDTIDSRSGRIEGEVRLGGGDDRFQGGAGFDRVAGGAGKDVMTGGAGADVFVYTLASEGRDKIQDWSRADNFEIEAAGFGGGLVAGALPASRFVSGKTNKALDGNDRFIFRTTDATLWFDVDGKGGAGPVLIADLQAGAKLAAADILPF